MVQIRDMMTGQLLPEVSDGRQRLSMRAFSRRLGQMVANHARRDPAFLQANYDIAQTTRENARHWSQTDTYDPDRANSPGVRAFARERSRYEVANNSYCAGIVETRVNHEIGTGPTLEVLGADPARSAAIERRWREWAEAVDLVDRLCSVTFARISDGEGFGMFRSNPGLETETKLDWFDFECDRCQTPWLPWMTPNRIDGIWFDDFGRPTFYDILKFHPGGIFPMPSIIPDTIPAEFITHLFRRRRPGQHRGMPEIAPGLPLFAILRRYTLAVLGAAETAADISLLFETTLPPEGMAEPIEAGATDLPRGVILSAPAGWTGKQIEPKQPTAAHAGFQASVINEAARCLDMPYGIAAANSKDYNFASGRLDSLPFFLAVGMDQRRTTRHIVRPAWRAWWAEARRVYRQDFGDLANSPEPPPAEWHWMCQPYMDPEAQANAFKTDLISGRTNHATEFARAGKDWRREFQKAADALGISLAEYQALLVDNMRAAKGGMQGGGTAPAAKPPQGLNGHATPPAAPQKQAQSAAAASPPPPLAGHNEPAITAAPTLTMLTAAAPPSPAAAPTLLERYAATGVDPRNPDHHSCGACETELVAALCGAPPRSLAQWKEVLGTDAHRGTDPRQICACLAAEGLAAELRQGMTLADLAAATVAGKPVIILVQDWENEEEPGALLSGHYLTALLVAPGLLIAHDPSIENDQRVPGGDVPAAEADPSQNLAARGLVPILAEDLERNWKDQAADGTVYDHCGIVVGPGTTAPAVAAAVALGVLRATGWTDEARAAAAAARQASARADASPSPRAHERAAEAQHAAAAEAAAAGDNPQAQEHRDQAALHEAHAVAARADQLSQRAARSDTQSHHQAAGEAHDEAAGAYAALGHTALETQHRDQSDEHYDRAAHHEQYHEALKDLARAARALHGPDWKAKVTAQLGGDVHAAAAATDGPAAGLGSCLAAAWTCAERLFGGAAPGRLPADLQRIPT